MLNYILPTSLIALGAFLEVYYYFWRFNQDGIPWALAAISGLALTAFLIGLSQKGPRWLYLLVIVFSVINTSSGQHAALGEEGRRQATEAVRAKGQSQTIADLERERDAILKAPVTVTNSLWARDRYQEASKSMEAEKQAQDARLAVIQGKLEAMRLETVAVTPRETVYQYYSRVSGVPADWIEILLQTLLSVFFALMAPVGMKMWPKVEGVVIDWEPLVGFWWDASMVSWKAGKGMMTSRDMVLGYAKKKGIGIDDHRYGVILKAAESGGVVKDLVPLELDRDKAVKKIMLTLA